MLGMVAKVLAMRQHPKMFQPLQTAIAFLEAACLDLVTAQEDTGKFTEYLFTLFLGGFLMYEIIVTLSRKLVSKKHIR